MSSDKKTAQLGAGEVKAIVLIILFIAAVIFGYRYLISPKPVTETDKIFASATPNQSSFSSNEAIHICSTTTPDCYTGTASIYSEFGADGKVQSYVNLVTFSDGTFLVFKNTLFPGTGTDSKGNTWRLTE